MSRHLIVLVQALLTLAGVQGSLAGTGRLADPAAAQLLRSTSVLVAVDVLVLDRRTGLRVDDLAREDFELRDNGRPVQIAQFSRGDERPRPFALALCIEVDNSIRPLLPRLDDRLARALGALQPSDQVAVFAYDPRAFWPLQPLTGDRGRVTASLAQAATLRPGAAAPFKKFEALPHAIDAFVANIGEHHAEARAAIVVIGTDFGVLSGTLVGDLRARLVAAGITVNALVKTDAQARTAKLMTQTLTAASFGAARANPAAYLSGQTGGETIEVRGDDYGEPLERLLGNLAHRYVLGFVPQTAALDGKPHALDVAVRPAAIRRHGKAVRIVARSTYIAKP